MTYLDVKTLDGCERTISQQQLGERGTGPARLSDLLLRLLPDVNQSHVVHGDVGDVQMVQRNVTSGRQQQPA